MSPAAAKRAADFVRKKQMLVPTMVDRWRCLHAKLESLRFVHCRHTCRPAAGWTQCDAINLKRLHLTGICVRRIDSYQSTPWWQRVSLIAEAARISLSSCCCRICSSHQHWTLHDKFCRSAARRLTTQHNATSLPYELTTSSCTMHEYTCLFLKTAFGYCQEMRDALMYRWVQDRNRMILSFSVLTQIPPPEGIE